MKVTIDKKKIELAQDLASEMQCDPGRLVYLNSQLYKEMPEEYLTEIRAAAIFGKMYKLELRYNRTSGTYYYYNGRYWEKDLGDIHARKAAKEFARLILVYCAKIENDDLRAAALKFYSKYNSKRSRDNLLIDAQTELHILESDFDKHPHLFNVRNGTLNLQTMALQDHDPNDLLTNYTDTEYKEGAKSKLWEKFISDILPSDRELQKYVQKAVAYGMTGNPNLERMFILYGNKTRNGKSTMLNAISTTLGSYAANSPPEILQRRFKDSSAPSEDLARLDKCRFLTISEPDRSMIFDVALIKSLTGRDTITARRLRENSFEFVPKFAMFLNTNYLPRVFDETLFTGRRVEVIPFERHFTEAEEDINLKAKLTTEESRTAILSWMIEGLKMLESEGLTAPFAVRTATRVYEQNSDKLQRYIDSRLEETDRPALTVKDCYSDYVAWCASEGYTAEGKWSFTDKLRAKNLILASATVNGKTVRNVVGEKDNGLLRAYKLSE